MIDSIHPNHFMLSTWTQQIPIFYELSHLVTYASLWIELFSLLPPNDIGLKVDLVK